MMPEATKPIFLHGLWRTGTTYFWQKFKQSDDQLRCFFEPFHHSLQKSLKALSNDYETASSRFDLNFVRNNYYAEYEVGANGVEGYDWRFATDDYHITEARPHKAIGRYIGGLCALAQNNQQRPLMQFNRSILRAEWLHKAFNASSLYIVRAPMDSYNSYNRLKRGQRLNYYMSCFTGIVGRNARLALFRPMAQYLKVDFVENSSFWCHLKHYAKAFGRLPEQKRIDLFAFFWTLGLMEATLYADNVLDTSLALEREPGEVTDLFEKDILAATGMDLDLSDLNVRSYHLSDTPFETSERGRQIIAAAVNLINPDWDKFEQWELSEQTRRLIYQNCNMALRQAV